MSEPPPVTIIPAADVAIPDYLQTLLEEIAEREGFSDYKITSTPGSNIGDGFQGLMLSVVIDGTRNNSNNNNDNDKLVLICKIPPVSEFRRELSVVPFEKEIHMYETILPEIAKFQQEKGVIDTDEGFYAFPKCYGTFANAAKFEFAIVLEDLRHNGYRMWNKYKPIDFNHVKLAVAAMGKLHALSFAVREQRPELFEKFTKVESTLFKALKDFPPALDMFRKCFDKALDTLNDDDTEERNMIVRLRENFNELVELCTSTADAEPYTVLCHGDFWNNNTMFEYASADSLVPIRVCLIDWQLSQYCSPATDLSYYIYSSTEQKLRNEHFDHILRAYHDNLAALLTRLGGCGERQFSFGEFENQMNRFGLYGMTLAPMLVQVVTVKPEDLPDMDALTMDDAKDFDFMKNGNADGYAVRISDVIRDFVARGYFGNVHLACCTK